MSFTPFAKMQEKQKETEAELGEALRQLSNAQAQLQKGKSHLNPEAGIFNQLLILISLWKRGI